ncbi:Cysteine protease ATG4A-like [Oopsacas minuta]|uniref:Cysteine protease n=1 Tax=Oopsacas minuta TaxID=111878 RepID=A0AAV7JYA2_9METZ|nr:Cysteine protease ATG4A-like [Oopsacas minuta]
MSEPLNMRVSTNINNINKEFVVVSKSSRQKHESFNGISGYKDNNKPAKMQDSYQVYSIKPSSKIDTNLDLKMDLPSLESIGAPPENVSTSDTQIDTSVSSCVFVSDQNTTMDLSNISEPDPTNMFHPLLLLIPLRLGQDKFNLEYARPLMTCFKLPQSVGIIGGRPKHALYLIGYQDDHIFYLDPHTTQSTVTTPQGSVHIPDKTFHTNHVESMHFSELDPSLAIGFFCETEAVFEDLLDQLETHVLSQKPKLFEISDSIPFLFNRPNSIGTNTKQEPFSLVDKDDLLNDVIDLALDEDIDDWDIIPEHIS